MILAVDVGNTNIVSAIYDNDKLCFLFRCKTEKEEVLINYTDKIKDIFVKNSIDIKSIDGVIISSVVPMINQTLSDVILKLSGCKAKILDSSFKTGLSICTDNPEKVGSDILCGAAKAFDKYKTSVIVFDFGTANTVCAVDNHGNYLGHSICPGIWTSFRALSEFTAKLPMIDMIPDRMEVIGKNTTDSIRSGVVLGTACFVDGMVEKYKKILGDDARVVATGGLARVILPHCETDVDYEENLLLDGLNFLYGLN